MNCGDDLPVLEQTDDGDASFDNNVHYSSTGPHQQEDDHEGRHEQSPLCGRPGTGGEWQTGVT